ncbi:hypothetical protein LTR28_005061 [Elasticomyces elasticus]|nr:hypothetical protein LTR28_005061 [Elasticomyces elasticus]
MPPRYFKNDASLSSRASLKRLVEQYPPADTPPGGGLYKGPVSIAYLFLILQTLYSELTIEDIPLGTWSAAYLKQAQDHMKSYPGPTVGRCGVSDDIMALLAIGAASSKDKDMAAELCDYAAEAVDPDSESEWLYGRAGYLYLLRLVRASFVDDRQTLDLIRDTAEDVIEAILESARPWKWHGKAYVGAVHGAIGIITQIVLTEPRYARDLEAEMAVQLSFQFESGNWPSSIPPGRDRLVQVCHGAPGVIVSLLSIRQYFSSALQDKIDAAIRKGRACVLERGLLTKEPCLCHGISGNALALRDAEFEHFLTYTTGHEMKGLERDGMMVKSDAPGSLWCGEAGRAWAWAVADKGLDKRLLGYNDL